MAFNAALHPRGPNGRFTRSYARPMTALDGVKAKEAKTGFKARAFKGAEDARKYLAGLFGGKSDKSGGKPGPAAAGSPGGIKAHIDSGALGRANETLRAGKSGPEVQAIDKEMKPLPDGLDLYRSVPAKKFGNVDPKSLDGMLVSDAGYFPTTVAPSKSAPGNVQVHVQAPAGTPAAADPDSGRVVLGHGVEMAVDSVDVTPDGGTRVNLIALPGKEGAPPGTGAGPVAPESPSVPAATPATPSAPVAQPTVPAAARPYHTNVDGLEGLADSVEAQDVAERQQLAGGEVGEVERVVLADGTVVFRKRNTDWMGRRSARESTDAEQLASRIGQVLGAPVPRVYRTEEDTIHTDWAQGRVAEELYDDPMLAQLDRPPDNDLLRGAVSSNAGQRIGLMDILVNNPDRHSGNWMVTDDGHVTGIDHGLSWNDRDNGEGLTDAEFAQVSLGDLASPFTSNFFDLGPDGDVRLRGIDAISPGDVEEIRRRLESLRPEFEHLGRGPWLDHSMRMLDILGPHATGTGSIFDD